MSIYSTEKAFQVYKTYLALKRHFTSTYDYFKYNGKINASQTSFETRKDRFFFFKLSKRSDWKQLLLANLVVDPKMWIGDMLEPKAEERLLEWMKRQQAFSYHFENDLKKLDPDFDSNFLVEDGQWPTIIKLYNQREISLDTVAALVSLIPCRKYWDRTVSDSILFPDVMNVVDKYRPFLNLDEGRLKKIIRKNFEDSSS